MNETYKIRSVGGCLMVTVPQQVSQLLRLQAGDEVVIRATPTNGGTMTVERAKKPTSKGRSK